MNTPIRILILSLVLFVAGCQNSSDSIRSFTHATGGIMHRDIQQADAMRAVLPGHLGLSPRQMQVTPGSGVTHVKIWRVDDEAARKRIAAQLETLNSKKSRSSWVIFPHLMTRKLNGRSNKSRCSNPKRFFNTTCKKQQPEKRWPVHA